MWWRTVVSFAIVEPLNSGSSFHSDERFFLSCVVARSLVAVEVSLGRLCVLGPVKRTCRESVAANRLALNLNEVVVQSDAAVLTRLLDRRVSVNWSPTPANEANTQVTRFERHRALTLRSRRR